MRKILKISISKLYFIIVILFMSIIFISYSSYALFSIHKEKKNMISITTGNFIYKLENSQLIDQRLTIGAFKTKMIDVELCNLNLIENYYQLYYEKNDAILIYYQENHDVPNGVFTFKDQKSVVSLVIVNQSNKEQEVILGVQGGFKDEVLLLEKGRQKIEKVLVDEVKAPEITGGSIDFQKENAKVMLKTPGKATSGVKNYEYYITDNKNDVPSYETFATGTTDNEVTITDRGYHYIYYRSISYVGNKSEWTEAQLVKYDNEVIKLIATNIFETGSLLISAVRYSFDVNSILPGDILEYKFKTTSPIRDIVVDFNDKFLCTEISSMCVTNFFEDENEYVIKGEFLVLDDMIQDRYSKLRFLDININEEKDFDPNTFVTSYEVYVHRL